MSKQKSSVKKRCAKCILVRRNGVLFVRCETRRHNQKQGG